MSFGMPNARNGVHRSKNAFLSTVYQDSFGGLKHTLGASDGDVWDMTNLSSDNYPLISVRPKRKQLAALTKGNGIYSRDGLLYVDGTKLYFGGTEVSGLTLTDSAKTMCALGDAVLIMPDKKWYNVKTGQHGAIEASTSLTAVQFKNGTIFGEEAKCNSIYQASTDFGSMFHAGDAVTISGCTTHTENNKTPIIREISDDGHTLRFYEYTFVLDGEEGETDYTEPGTVTIARTMPDLDYMCQNENRIWGCKGDTIYACKLGDMTNWNVFDGVATDSYAVDVGSDEDFTGMASYLGYPVVFKPHHIYKVYGSVPSNFQVMGSATLGVAQGSSRSLAVAGETLFYLSPTGIVAYSGGMPSSIQAPLGDAKFSDAVAGSDGRKYYVSMRSGSTWTLYVFDTQCNTWHKEDGLHAVGFAYRDNLYALTAEHKITTVGKLLTDFTGTEESSVSFSCEFGDYYEDSPNSKTSAKMTLRLEVGANSTANVYIKYDSTGEWMTVKSLTADTKRSWYLPYVPHRCDHYRIKITGTGDVKVYSLGREIYSGSPNRSRR